ncbi:uncharacterized protein [Coffea arabica]|uniref:Zinc finger PMZ-type domain-containing protein n=1 Tax=Coffea arabica TaxID=13443 RepID=A0A6P6V8M9_COFAR|nr:uncharacterized protein LOC113718253 [Coffea arabica]
MTSKLATRLFVDKVRKTLSMVVQELMTRVTEELNVDFSLIQGYMTMKKVRDMIEGSHEKQYALLEDFYGELRRANPGSTVFVETDTDEDGIIHRGLALKERLWKCAKASYVTYWKVEMEQLGQESTAAHSWLDEKDPKTWCRAHFRYGLDCDILVNNMCEFFNAVIKGEVITNHIHAADHLFVPAEEDGEEQGSNVQARRKWQLRGIPCSHAVAAINSRHEAPEKHVSNTYLKITYLQIYEPVLNPINDSNLWKHIDLPVMKPPTCRRPTGKPKKMGKKASEEERWDSCVNPTKPRMVSKVGTMMNCSRCKKYGHNKKGCPDKNKQTIEGTTRSLAKENSDIGDTAKY